MPSIKMIRDYAEGNHYPKAVHVTVYDRDSIDEITVEFIIPKAPDSYVQIRRKSDSDGSNKEAWEIFTNFPINER